MNLKIINSFHLKNIALITMIIDHLGCVFFDDKVIFRIIGRASFVLYAFGLVNGINYTSDRSKYLKKLFIWGVISEIPFDLVFNDSLVSFESQNVFFTLFIGALSISLFNQYKSILIKSCILITGLFIGYLGKFDYSWYGVGLIYGIIPYNYTIEHQDADKDLKIPLYPIGYIAWCIAKKYEEIYKDTDKYDVWGHGIEDLFFDSFVLKSNNVLKINICS